jgi:hypothetical protein
MLPVNEIKSQAWNRMRIDSDDLRMKTGGKSNNQGRKTDRLRAWMNG